MQTLPDHAYRELVNALRDTAVKYAYTQQLREQLSHTLSDYVIPEREAKAHERNGE